jgi:HEXXH motif-containing protein
MIPSGRSIHAWQLSQAIRDLEAIFTILQASNSSHPAVLQFIKSYCLLRSLSKDVRSQIFRDVRFLFWVSEALWQMNEDASGSPRHRHLFEFNRFALAGAWLEHMEYSADVALASSDHVCLPAIRLYARSPILNKTFANLRIDRRRRAYLNDRPIKLQPTFCAEGFEFLIDEPPITDQRISKYRPLKCDEVQFTRWREALRMARKLLNRDPASSDLVATFGSTIIPLQGSRNRAHLSVSFRSMPGILSLSYSVRPEVIAEALVHESDHQFLYAASRRYDWWTTPVSQQDAKFRSPWRPDPRPLNGLLFGASSFISIGSFLANISQRPLEPLCSTDDCQYRAVLSIQQSLDALDLVAKYGKMTTLGAELVAKLRRRAQAINSKLRKRAGYEVWNSAAAVERDSHNSNWRNRNAEIDMQSS